MVSTFVNPMLGAATRLGTRSLDETEPMRLWSTHSDEDAELVIRAVYKQVLGNAHVMDNERLQTAESQLKNGELTVRGFVRQVALSELYRSRFFEPCSRNRFIELSFKHLLGRAPDAYDDIAYHSNVLEQSGYEADVDAFLESEEYLQSFGEDIVPFYRGYKTQIGHRLVSFTHHFKLFRGAASSDRDGHQARLNASLMHNQASAIHPVSGLPDNLKGLFSSALGTSPSSRMQAPISSVSGSQTSPQPDVATDLNLQAQYQGLKVFLDSDPVELISGATSDDVDIVIRAVYRQVMGNAHIMESERIVGAESQLRHGNISVREFVRQIAKSELYRRRFHDNCYRYRAIELNFKHLLGRAPQSFDEMKLHSAILDRRGFEADIDSYLDSDEYQSAFGEYWVPYYRGAQTQTGQTMAGFQNLFKLLRSASSSDKSQTIDNAPQLTQSIISRANPRNQVSNVQEILAEVFRPKFSTVDVAQTAAKQDTAAEIQQKINEQDALIAQLQAQLAELRPLAGIGAYISQQVQTISQSNSQPDVPFRAMSTGANATDSPQSKVSDQAVLIEQLQREIADARPLATLGNAKLNKWRRLFR